MRGAALLAGLCLIAGCSKPSQSSPEGYLGVDAKLAGPLAKAVGSWRDCLLYGIDQVDDPRESSIAIADAAMAGCTGAETNLEDHLFASMRGTDTDLEVRAQAHDEVASMRERMRNLAIRWVLEKHHQRGAERGKQK